jgi:hypothetical protein
MSPTNADPLDDPLLYLGVAGDIEREARRKLLRYCHRHGATVEQLREPHDSTAPDF